MAAARPNLDRMAGMGLRFENFFCTSPVCPPARQPLPGRSFAPWLTQPDLPQPAPALNIVALDDKGNPGVTWSLKNALPIGYELMPMDGSRSEVLSESLTFAITGMERAAHGPVEGAAQQEV